MKEAVSEKILAIRSKAGNPGTHCPTCTRAAGDPFRAYNDNGEVQSGCVDAFHTGQLRPYSESAVWHYRPVAVTLRKNELARLTRP